MDGVVFVRGTVTGRLCRVVDKLRIQFRLNYFWQPDFLVGNSIFTLNMIPFVPNCKSCAVGLLLIQPTDSAAVLIYSLHHMIVYILSSGWVPLGRGFKHVCSRGWMDLAMVEDEKRKIAACSSSSWMKCIFLQMEGARWKKTRRAIKN